MFSGAQISLYPMTDDFVDVILGAIGALDPYRPNFRIETDDISTLIVGPPDQIFPAMRDLFLAASRRGVHCVLAATVSRGCPGEPDDPVLPRRRAQLLRDPGPQGNPARRAAAEPVAAHRRIRREAEGRPREPDPLIP